MDLRYCLHITLIRTSRSAYNADNATVNYGKHKGIFVKLKEASPNLIAANCNAHVLHNMSHYAAKITLDEFDVEHFVLKVFSDFSHSAKKCTELESLCDFVEIEYQEILRHIVTRWLSLE